jgi:hypothetical protein
MAKVSGLTSALIVGTADLSGDTGAVDAINTTITTLDVTSIADTAMSRLPGLADGEIGWTGFFNVSPGQEHPVLSALPTTDVTVTYIGPGASASLLAKQIHYAVTRGADGSLTIAVNAQGNGAPVEWGVAL